MTEFIFLVVEMRFERNKKKRFWIIYYLKMDLGSRKSKLDVKIKGFQPGVRF